MAILSNGATKPGTCNQGTPSSNLDTGVIGRWPSYFKK
ncbi:hypothetical protein ABENE_14580 [Asticcacaulis benevestitus DSM 16100 = ATCC BAA-896]|uniref:Uncharacterized protein n=1 Tax=Asticcacaulis benevestitus DSM 16100 = ATCC BAA-896 TaxID=1121022 RepID=V4PUH2_9CAUL|nr:hypothetical protein ABENE_14580 [Asticcacaulis benevestitus DSM 16100 = ATCC BAA-896]